MLRKAEAASDFSREFLEQLVDHPTWREQPTAEVEALMVELFAQGRREGHLDPTVSDQLLSLYVNIAKAGTESMARELSSLDPDDLRALVAMFFRGMEAQPR